MNTKPQKISYPKKPLNLDKMDPKPAGNSKAGSTNIKKTGTFHGQPNKLGGGGRFKQLESKLSKKGATNPGALAAYIGREKYGKAKFQKLAAKGK